MSLMSNMTWCISVFGHPLWSCCNVCTEDDADLRQRRSEAATGVAEVAEGPGWYTPGRYRSLLWPGLNFIDPWEGEQHWSCLSSQAGTLLKFGVKQGWGGGGSGTLDDKSPDVSVKELPLLPLVRLHSRNDWAALCAVILGKPQMYFEGMIFLMLI